MIDNDYLNKRDDPYSLSYVIFIIKKIMIII